MNLLDIVLLVIALAACVTGAMRGLVAQIGTIAGLLAGILVCRFFGHEVVAYFVSPGSEHAAIVTAVVYALMFIVVYIGVNLLASLLGTAMGKMHIRILDRVAGALFRTVAWLVLASVLINVYLTMAPADRAVFSNPHKPWRGAVVKMAPSLMGFITN